MTGHSLTSEQIAYISDYLTSPGAPAGSLDYTAAHGYLCACAIISDEIDSRLCLMRLTGEDADFVSDEQKHNLMDIIEIMHRFLSRQFYLGEEMDFPMKVVAADNNKTNQLTDWCFGFMEAVGDDEADWFSGHKIEEQVAELLLPISILSEPYTDPELVHLADTPKKKQRLASDIPDSLQQLYLLFRD